MKCQITYQYPLRCVVVLSLLSFYLFFFNDTATTEIYTLSLHDALPIWVMWPSRIAVQMSVACRPRVAWSTLQSPSGTDRKSTRLNSSHGYISYAVFCLKKKNTDDAEFNATGFIPSNRQRAETLTNFYTL